MAVSGLYQKYEMITSLFSEICTYIGCQIFTKAEIDQKNEVIFKQAMKKSVLATLLVVYVSFVQAQVFQPEMWGDWQTWGVQPESGMYVNPVLPADFSDIDCIKHDGVYYAISSTMQYEPGMVILRSTDMVNWSICSHAVTDVSQIGRGMTSDEMGRYGRGVWAGAIRWHNGRFYVYFGCPDEGMFMTSAEHIEGPWDPLAKMNIPGGWDDCCPLFDSDGQNYFVATHFADGYKTYMFPLSDDGLQVDWEQRVLINEGYGREANKLYKFDGRYYHLYSEDKDGGRYLMMQRAAHPMGPYTEQHRLSYTQREWNEPNQGGYLQDDQGNWFFLTHHGTGDWGGRQASLLHVTWMDGWPIIGEPDSAAVGRMVLRHSMPCVDGRSAAWRATTQFRGFGIPDWEWNHHPRENSYVRKSRTLTLYAQEPLEQGNLLKANGTLTLRSWQVPHNEVTVRMDTRHMAEGQCSGLCHLGEAWSALGVVMNDGQKTLCHRDSEGNVIVIAERVPSFLYLRSTWGLDGQAHYAYSKDGKRWLDTGIVFPMQWGFYRGDRIGLFTYNDKAARGQATFSRFCYTCSDHAPLSNPFGKALLPDMIADASIEEIDGCFYCYATTDGYGRGLETSGPPTLWKSKDFVHWTFNDTYFPQAEKQKYWAPSKAVRYGDKWYIYPTVNGYMYPAVAESPDGPFEIAKGDSFTVANRLWEKDHVHAIDAEVFVDDDGTPYVFWGSRHVARLKEDMITIDTLFAPIPTRRQEYSEGPIFFKRKGIYYYLYTIGGDEHYEYYYQMSKDSPIGPWITPEQDNVCSSNHAKGVFGPGHGSVFHVEESDDWYLAFLEFGRNSTNRMTYVNRLEFNDDGTIRPVDVNLEGVGLLHPSVKSTPLHVKSVRASSMAQPHKIRRFKERRCQRTEQFAPPFAVDMEYGSRWMATDEDSLPNITIDLGRRRKVRSSEVAFVRPTQGHSYMLEVSNNGREWNCIENHKEIRKCSPHIDNVGMKTRYLRITITGGVPGIWEWTVY